MLQEYCYYHKQLLSHFGDDIEKHKFIEKSRCFKKVHESFCAFGDSSSWFWNYLDMEGETGWPPLCRQLLNTFSWMKILFWLKIHWNLFKRFQLRINQHWFREWLGAEQAINHYLNQWWFSLLTHICVPRPQWLKVIINWSCYMPPSHKYMNTIEVIWEYMSVIAIFMATINMKIIHVNVVVLNYPQVSNIRRT